jgi:serine/threonine protein kinase
MNKYEIIGIVGEGAYGIVYKAKYKDTGAFGKYNNTFLLHFMDNSERNSYDNLMIYL